MTMQSMAALSSRSISTATAAAETDPKETRNDMSIVQSSREEIPWTSKEEVEKKLASILIQVQQDQIKRLDLTAPTLGRFYELANTWNGHESMVCSLAVLKNGVLASGSDYPESAIKLWNLASHSCLSVLAGHTVDVNALAVLPNGLLASGSDDKTIKLWGLASNSCLATLRGHAWGVYALATLPNGLLASGSRDKTVKLWDLASHSCLATLKGHTDRVYALAFFPNGLLASGSWDNTIKLWDLTSHSCLFTLQGHTGWILALAVLSNSLLASGSGDKTIKIWDSTSHSCLATLQGHARGIYALTVLPNGFLASGSGDNTIKLWHLASCSCLSTLEGHTSPIWTLTAHPNGQLASGSADTTIKLWESKTLSAKYLSAILNALEKNTSVTDLDVSGNRDILDDLIGPLISLFTQDTSLASKPNTSLKTIDIRRTGVSQKGVKRLEKAIQQRRLSIEVLADCPLEWKMIYFLIIFCRANRNSPFADSGLDLCKYEFGPLLGVPSGFFDRPLMATSSHAKHAAPFLTNDKGGILRRLRYIS